MPFCGIDTDVSLHYITNTPRGDTTDLDRTKHTIVFLPPVFGDVTVWLREQFKDPRLSQTYNLIAFDQRNMGATKAPLDPRRDSWVDAADLAIAHETLQLPPCHFFGISMNGCSTALRFAALFPGKCLSVCLCGMPVQAGEDPEWILKGYHDVVRAYCFPTDLESLEHACMENAIFAFNNQISTKLQDEAVAWWQVNLPPTKRTQFLAQGLCALNRSRLSSEGLRSIETPALFLQGDKSQINPPDKAQELSHQIPYSRLFVVKGGPEFMHFIPEYSSVVNRIYAQFLKENSTTAPCFPPDSHKPDINGVCGTGLQRLVVFANDPSVAHRNTSTPVSFSCLSAATIAENANAFAEFTRGESEAFHALNEYGQPIRRFSKRHKDEWKADRLQRQNSQDTQLSPVFHTSLTYEE